MLVLAVVVGYLLGSFPSADIVTRLLTRGRVDLRSAGSGNPGALNTYQVIGVAGGATVLALDVAKGAAAALAGAALAGDAGAYAAATAAIAGHVLPVWSRFRGGKGVATSAGVCLVVFPAYFPIDLVVALLGALRSRRAEAGTQVACAIWVLSALLWWAFDWPNWWGPPPAAGLVGLATVGSALILGAFARARRSIVA